LLLGHDKQVKFYQKLDIYQVVVFVLVEEEHERAKLAKIHSVFENFLRVGYGLKRCLTFEKPSRKY
jgi:hypothetical protein